MAKPDYQKAQEIIREAMHKAVKDCGFTDQVFEFGVAVSSCHAALMVSMCPSSILMEPGGVERAAGAFTTTFHEILMTMLAERAEEDRKKARH